MIKQVLKKVVATALAMSCALSLVQTFEPMNAKAKIEYNVFQNKHSVEDCGIGFITEKKQVELLDETVTKKIKKKKQEIYLLKGFVLQPNCNLYFYAPGGTHAGGKAVSVKSSNSKLVTVKDASKGLLRVNNGSGKSWISYTIKFNYPGDFCWKFLKSINESKKYFTGERMMISKKGKTCTLTYKALIYISCTKQKHSYGAWKITDKPTCVGSGTKKRICKKCHHEEIKEIKATNKHNYGSWKIKKATCEEDGYKYRQCKVCDKEEEIITKKATGHTYDPMTHKCTKCGKYDPEYDEDADV